MKAPRLPAKSARAKPQQTSTSEENSMDVKASLTGSVHAVGPALAVIAVIAVLGLILICWKVVGVMSKALDASQQPQGKSIVQNRPPDPP